MPFHLQRFDYLYHWCQKQQLKMFQRLFFSYNWGSLVLFQSIYLCNFQVTSYNPQLSLPSSLPFFSLSLNDVLSFFLSWNPFSFVAFYLYHRINLTFSLHGINNFCDNSLSLPFFLFLFCSFPLSLSSHLSIILSSSLPVSISSYLFSFSFPLCLSSHLSIFPSSSLPAFLSLSLSLSFSIILSAAKAIVLFFQPVFNSVPVQC